MNSVFLNTQHTATTHNNNTTTTTQQQQHTTTTQQQQHTTTTQQQQHTTTTHNNNTQQHTTTTHNNTQQHTTTTHNNNTQQHTTTTHKKNNCFHTLHLFVPTFFFELLVIPGLWIVRFCETLFSVWWKFVIRNSVVPLRKKNGKLEKWVLKRIVGLFFWGLVIVSKNLQK